MTNIVVVSLSLIFEELWFKGHYLLDRPWVWNAQVCSPVLPKADCTSSAIHTPPISLTYLTVNKNSYSPLSAQSFWHKDKYENKNQIKSCITTMNKQSGDFEAYCVLQEKWLCSTNIWDFYKHLSACIQLSLLSVSHSLYKKSVLTPFSLNHGFGNLCHPVT